MRAGSTCWPARRTVPPADRKEDHSYYTSEMARVNAELVRPLLLPHSGGRSTERAREHLLWSFLLRSIQTKMYIHSCTGRYCLYNRRTCRFFYPWPEQPHQAPP